MNKRLTQVAVLAIVVVAGIYFATLRTPVDAPVAASPATQAPEPVVKTPPTAAASPAASVAAAPANAATSPASPAPIPLRAQLLASNDWRAFFEGIDAMASVPLSERMLYKAVILETCALTETAERIDRQETGGVTGEVTALLKGLMQDEKQRAAVAFNMSRRIPSLCRGFAGRKIEKDEVEAAYGRAAAAGSPAAQARVIAAQLSESAQRNAANVPAEYAGYAAAASGRVGFPDPITPEQREQLVNAIFSGDPIAIRSAGSLLSAGTDRQSLRFGAEQIDPGPHTGPLWTLVACQFGLECGPLNMEVSVACAQRAQCAPDYASYLRDYAMTPRDFAALQANAQAIIDAIHRRDNAAFQLVNAPGQNRTLVGGPRPVRIR